MCNPVQAASPEELEAHIEALAKQLADVRAELAAIKERDAIAPADVARASAAPTPANVIANASSSALTWASYGELNYSRPRERGADASADVGRFVLGASYRFDDRTRMVSELEVEHAVSSADDSGEVEVEQLYVERRVADSTFAKFGLFLLPVGLLNEFHEPTRYYGVFRNTVETAIIPTTWREGGVLLDGTTDGGLRWNVGVTTSFDLNKWDPTSQEGRESPLASIHQELSLARAGDLGGVVALNYRGVPGLLVGGSLFSGNSTHGTENTGAGRVTLWETHARWTPGPLELSALYAHGRIGDTARFNTPLVGNPVLVPETFDGGFVEAAWRVVDRDTLLLAPFVRYERVNTAKSFAAIAPGLTPDASPTSAIWTGGINVLLKSGVVFKADYQTFRRDRGADRFDLGVGYSF
jgi:hypothetical protein